MMEEAKLRQIYRLWVVRLKKKKVVQVESSRDSVLLDTPVSSERL